MTPDSTLWREYRKSWTDYITSRGHRLFTANPGAVPKATREASDGVRNFVAKLSEDDRNLVGGIYFLVSPALVRFVDDLLPKLLRALSHGSEARITTSRGGIRGHLRWGATVKGRMTGRMDEGSFVVAQRFRSTDIPENQLVKSVLVQVMALAAGVRHSLGVIAKPHPDGEDAEQGERKLGQLVVHVEKAAADALRHPYMRDVSSATVTSQMRQAARRRRGAGYKVAAILERRLGALRHSTFSAVLDLARDQWLDPANDDDLFELYTLVRVLTELEEGLGYKVVGHFGLMRKDRDSVAEVVAPDGTRVIVYADTGMQTFVKDSEYVGVLNEYEDFEGASHRRPDIVLRLQGPFADRFLLLEMKRSDDSQYLRNGLYKVFGYLRDFEELWTGHTGQPKAIVMVPGRVRPLVPRTNRDAAVSGTENSQWLRALMRDGLQLTGLPHAPAGK